MTEAFNRPQNENPGALAGATGVEFDSADGLESYLSHMADARVLCRAQACVPLHSMEGAQ